MALLVNRFLSLLYSVVAGLMLALALTERDSLWIALMMAAVVSNCEPPVADQWSARAGWEIRTAVP